MRKPTGVRERNNKRNAYIYELHQQGESYFDIGKKYFKTPLAIRMICYRESCKIMEEKLKRRS